MSSSDSLGPEQLRGLIGGPRRRSAEDILKNLGSTGQAARSRSAGPGSPETNARMRRPDPRAQASDPRIQAPQGAPGQELIGHHDNAIRNHLAGLVREMLQTGDTAKLRELLIEHRNFIDGILALLEGKNPG